MAPSKRKRNDRNSIDSQDSQRPSPHRPNHMNLGQHDRNRGGSGGRGGRRPERRNSNNVQRNFASTPGPVSPAVTTPQPPTPSPKFELPPPQSSPRKPPAFYDYTYVTNERVAAWQGSGRQEVIGAARQALADEDSMDLSFTFQEIIRSAIDGRIEPSDAGTVIKEILQSTGDQTQSFNPETLFLDNFSILMEAEGQKVDPRIRDLILRTEISDTTMRKVLDAPVLQVLGLVRDTFIRAGIRQVTNLLYRQANYNLLREETEGYSKLITELFTTSGSEPPSSEVVEETFERIKGLIGTFDLDVGRVLDVTLDVFAAVLIKHFRFFIKLLRVSSWWPREIQGPHTALGGLPKWALPSSQGWIISDEEEEAMVPLRAERDAAFWERARLTGLSAFFELGGREVVDEQTKQAYLARRAEHNRDVEGDKQWVEETGTLPPPGNRTAAQLLGFKLRFYSSDARDAGPEDQLPANLIYLAALLIKIGFISLRDLYPHLWPHDDAMEGVREARAKELAEKERLSRPGGGSNALTMAGALSDDTVPTNPRARDATKQEAKPTDTPADEEKDKLPEPADQKVLLLTNLLTIGAIPEALFILGQFPWLPEAYPDLLDLIHRILHHSLEKVYQDSRPLPDSTELFSSTKKISEPDAAMKGSLKQTTSIPRRSLRWPFPDKVEGNESSSYRFYWDEWADNVPICQTVDDVFTLCSTFLNVSGVNIGRDSSLVTKLARIGHSSLSRDSSEENRTRWHDLLKRLIVPALSLTTSNTAVANEVFALLRFFPTPTRYYIYAEWFEGQTSRLPAMKVAFARARLETLSTLKRISTTNISAMARALTKTAYANPGVVFKVALDQIEAYSNFTEVVIECAKYLTDLGYDVLVWSLLSSLGGKTRSRTQEEFALLTSRWLVSLSKFTGKVFKRYSIMNPVPVLQYVGDQICRGNATDLIILEEIIGQMAGVVSDFDYTDAQISAMTGGPVLRKRTLINLQDRRFESVKSAKRLMVALTETGLAGQLLVAIAQHRQAAIYKVAEDEAYIKYLATIIDDTQRILSQYLDLLRSNIPVEDFDNLVPSITELLLDFGLDPSLAFLISRASLAERMTAAVATTDLKTIQNGEAGDVDMKEIEADGAVADTNDTPEGAVDVETTSLDVQMADSDDPWRQILQPVFDAVKNALHPDIWESLSPEFYVYFWQLSLADIQMPMTSYELEMARLGKEQSDLIRDRSDMSRAGLARKEEARKNLEETRDALLQESKKQMLLYEQTKARLNSAKVNWLPRPAGKFNRLNDAILEQCLIPRLLLSPADADYCFKMIKFLHANGTPNFRTMGLYDQIFNTNRLRNLIFTCTIREAENLGRFLKHVLGDLAKWHGSKATYEKEAWGPNSDLPGFARLLDKDSKPKMFQGFEDFRRMLSGWHKKLNNALKICLSGTEWMHIRNATSVLKAIVDYFPAINHMGTAFQKIFTMIHTREARPKNADPNKDYREDIAVVAAALLPELKRREKNWVMPQAFSINLANGNATPEPATKSTLKPTALEFKPQSTSSVNGAKASKDVEDGEVNDAKLEAAKVDSDKKRTSLSPAPSERRPVNRETPRGGPRDTPRDNLRSSGPQHSHPDARNQGPPQRLPHSLPSRPEVPYPGHSPGDRLRQDRRDPRMDRPVDPRDRRQFNDDLRGDPNRVPIRGPERNLGPDRDRDRDPRWHGNDHMRDRDSRGRERDDRPGRADTGKPPRDSSAPPRQETSDDRPPLVNSERQGLINPARMALVSGDQEADVRRGRDEMDRPSSRQQSPRRGDRDFEARRDDRSVTTRASMPDLNNQSRARYEHGHPPVGPRSDREVDRLKDPSPFKPVPPAPRPVDPDHGRLNQPSRSQPDPNFGRLNANSEIPSGPRRGRGQNRNQGPSRAESRDARMPSPPSEMQPPSGPAGRGGRRQPSVADPNTTPSTPTGPAVHPDRLRQLGVQPATNDPPVHPDRLAALNPAPTHRMPRPPSPINTNTPSGPRNASTRSPIGTPVTPTGPANNDRTSRRDRQLTGIQNTLIQANQRNDRSTDRGTGRGRGRLSAVGGEVAQAPMAASSPLAPPRDVVHSQRADLIAEQPNLVEDEGSRPGREREPRRARSERHSHRGSRSKSPSRNGESKRTYDEERSRQEYRERRDRGEERGRRTGREPDLREPAPNQEHAVRGNRELLPTISRDRDPNKRDGRESRGARDDKDGRDASHTRDSRREDKGRDGRNDGGEWGNERGRGREQRSDRREPRVPREEGGYGGRKRRSEDANGLERNQDKRQRR